MADLHDPAQTAPEPSMEEILASIRKIIADENTPNATGETFAAAEDVVELTQMVQDDGSVVDLSAMPVSAPLAWPEPVAAAPPPEPMPAPAPMIDSASLMSERKVEEAASVFSSLAKYGRHRPAGQQPVCRGVSGQRLTHTGRHGHRADAADAETMARPESARHR